MKPVHLQFELEPASPRNKLLGRAEGLSTKLLVVSLVIASGLIVLAAAELMKVQHQLTVIQQQLPSAGRTLRPSEPERSTTLSKEQRRAWNQIVRQLNTPWASLLDGLEAATPRDVALVSIEPDAKAGIVRLQAEARTLDSLLLYAQRLKGAGPFTEVIPIKHETNEQDPNRPLRLTLNVRVKAVVSEEDLGTEAEAK